MAFTWWDGILSWMRLRDVLIATGGLTLLENLKPLSRQFGHPTLKLCCRRRIISVVKHLYTHKPQQHRHWWLHLPRNWFSYIQQQINVSRTLSRAALGLAPGYLQSLQCMALTLCRSNLKPYCMGRKAAFFQQALKFTYYTRNRSPLQEKKNHNN